ncbi:hypothetical protein Bca4012_024078 [Brassica carinata]
MGSKKFHIMAKKLLLLLLLIILNLHACSGSIVDFVDFLPGFEGPLPFELETGYIGLGEEEQVQLFYYFIKSEKNPKEDPLLLWLSGGPGCSSVSGLFFENGPFTFNVDEGYRDRKPTLQYTTHSWTKVANIIFLDQPVGTGFSYTRTQILDTPSDSRQAKQIHEFIRKHTEFISNLFMSVEIRILVRVMCYPVTDEQFDHNHRIPFSHGVALISDELYESLKKSCRGKYYDDIDPHNKECLKHLDEYEECLSGLNVGNVLIEWCEIPLVQRRSLLPGNVSAPYNPDGCYFYTHSLSSLWANDESVRKALHVVKGSIEEWVRCSSGKPYDSDIKSSVPYHMNNR